MCKLYCTQSRPKSLSITHSYETTITDIEIMKRNTESFLIDLSYFARDTLSNKSILLLGLEAHL